MLKKTKELFDRFKASVKGSVSMITALTTPVMILAAGFSLDYGLAMNAQKELKAAADTAALGALNEARVAYLNQEDVDLQELVKLATEKIFATRAEKFKFLDISSIRVEPSIINNVFSNKVTYAAKYKTHLMKHAGVDKIELRGTSKATVTTTAYVNINFLFDVSASMGIGATKQDQQIMLNTISCAFACHIDRPGSPGTYTRARDAGATMRIDVARNAAIRALRQIENNATVKDQVTFGVTTFSHSSNTLVPAGDPKAADYDYVTSRMSSGVHLTKTEGGTSIESAIKAIAEKTPKSGTGLTPDNRIQYLIVMTDGVEDQRSFNRFGHHSIDRRQKTNNPYHSHIHGMSASSCAALHKKGVGVFFVYTEYLRPQVGGNHSLFSFIEGHLHDILPTRFAQCTGDSDRVVKTTTSAQIEKAFDTIVGDITSPLRLY